MATAAIQKIKNGVRSNEARETQKNLKYARYKAGGLNNWSFVVLFIFSNYKHHVCKRYCFCQQKMYHFQNEISIELDFYRLFYHFHKR